MDLTKFSTNSQHQINLILLYDILLTTDPNILGQKLEQIETFSNGMHILNPIYATGNLYKGIYSLIDEKIYSSVVSRNAIGVFDYLGIKWSTEKVMMLQACGDYLTFYNSHYRWQDILKKFDYLSTLLERKRKRQEEKISSTSTIKSQYLQGILLEKYQEFFLDIDFIKFCEKLNRRNSPLLYEPAFLSIILEILNANCSNLNEIAIQKNSVKVIHRISRLNN